MSSSRAESEATEGPTGAVGTAGSTGTTPPSCPTLTTASAARPMLTTVQLDQRTMELLAAQVVASGA